MIVDFLTFTFPRESEKELESLAKEIDPGAVMLETNNGFASDMSLWGKGRFRWGHSGNVSARLSLSGSALALFREFGGDCHWLIFAVAEADGRCTRIDFAFDWETDASPIIDRIETAIVEEKYTSRWRLENSGSCMRMRSVRAPGDSLYLGSTQSDCRMVFYDKAAERREDAPRLRAEFRPRKERAHAMAYEFATGDNDPVAFVKSVILGYFDIKEPVEGDTNKSRWPTAPWWAEMWGQQKGRVVLGSDVPTEERSRSWFERLGPTLAILTELDGGDLSWMEETIIKGRQPVDKGGRWRPVHEAKLKAWEKARGKNQSPASKGGSLAG